jgi:hypothetical protein
MSGETESKQKIQKTQKEQKEEKERAVNFASSIGAQVLANQKARR